MAALNITVSARKLSVFRQYGHFRVILRSLCAKNDDGGNDDSSAKKREAASKKLAQLLNSFKVEGAKTIDDNLNLAKPIKLKREPVTVATTTAAEPVSLDGEMEEDLRAAVQSVAQDFGAMETESELLTKLRDHIKESLDVKEGKVDVGKLFIGMKIDRVKPTPRIMFKNSGESGGVDRANFEERPYQRYERRAMPSISELAKTRQKIALFGSKPTGLFIAAKDNDESDDISLNIWEKLEEREMKLMVTNHPANGFEEMIRWTEQGKLWPFPIDNEYGLEEESAVSFKEHVFLEKHLDGFPTKGPIKHFMELVTVGLSKNPFLTVQRKIDHIQWFRDYFEQKAQIIKESGALG